MGKFLLNGLYFLQSGTSYNQTFLWKTKIKRKHAKKCKRRLNFIFSVRPPSTDLVYEESKGDFDKNTQIDLDNIPRPWIRCFAKLIDLNFFAFLLSVFLISFFPPGFFKISDAMFFIIFIFFWTLIDPILLTIFGNTIGRSLLKTKILTKNGGRIVFYAALKRSFSLLFMGLGLGIPLLSSAFLLISYLNLKKDGETHWDRENNLQVVHGKLGFIKMVILILLFFSSTALLTICSAII